MSNVRQASPEAEQAAIAASGLTAEIERYEALASERRDERARLWDQAQRGGMSYVRIGAIAGIHQSKVHEAVLDMRARTKRRRRAS